MKELEVDSHAGADQSFAKAAMEHEDPSKVQLQLNAIAQANGFRDSGAMSKLLLAHEEFATGHSAMTLTQLLWEECENQVSDYIIPDLFPSPSTMLFHGRGGSGKTLTAMHIAHHVVSGKPYVIKGREVPVQKGRVLWLNGDQNPARLFRQFSEAGFKPGDDVIVLNNVSMLWQPWFIRMIKKYEPRLVVWDSVTSCNRGSAVDQNRAEYADPLYFLSQRNGSAFPAVGQLVIHHSNQEGGARGTTALEDAVDEVWSIRKPNKDEKVNGRIIEIAKSREDNSGRKFYVTRNDDYTLKIEENSEVANAGPQSLPDQMLGALRYSGGWLPWTKIKTLPVGGSESVRKAILSRLVSKGLVERKGKRGSFQYRAVLARDTSETVVTEPETQVTDSVSVEVTPQQQSSLSKQEKYETHDSSNEESSNTDESLPVVVTDENPVSDSDVPPSSNSGVSIRARDPFDSTGLTD